MSYFFSTPVDIDIVLEDTSDRQMVDVKLDKNRREKAPLYVDGESVKGAVTVRPKDGKRLEHMGIKVQFIGTIGKLTPEFVRCIGKGNIVARVAYQIGDGYAQSHWRPGLAPCLSSFNTNIILAMNMS